MTPLRANCALVRLRRGQIGQWTSREHRTRSVFRLKSSLPISPAMNNMEPIGGVVQKGSGMIGSSETVDSS
jgi:hypothetical protein